MLIYFLGRKGVEYIKSRKQERKKKKEGKLQVVKDHTGTRRLEQLSLGAVGIKKHPEIWAKLLFSQAQHSQWIIFIYYF